MTEFCTPTVVAHPCKYNAAELGSGMLSVPITLASFRFRFVEFKNERNTIAQSWDERAFE
jgi:hypothetical protein